MFRAPFQNPGTSKGLKKCLNAKRHSGQLACGSDNPLAPFNNIFPFLKKFHRIPPKSHATHILFSADSGVGKSTHTRLWQKHFGKDAVPIINDDQPVIRLADDSAYVYGSPFSGNSDDNQDLKVPLRTVVFLERSEKNRISRLSPGEAVPLFLKHIPRYSGSRKYMDMMLELLDRLLCATPVWRLRCNTDESAAVLAEEAIMRT